MIFYWVVSPYSIPHKCSTEPFKLYSPLFIGQIDMSTNNLISRAAVSIVTTQLAVARVTKRRNSMSEWEGRFVAHVYACVHQQNCNFRIRRLSLRFEKSEWQLDTRITVY